MRVFVVGLATFDQMTGGSARYMSGLIDWLRTAGHEVDVLTAGQSVETGGAAPTGFLAQLRRFVRRAVFVHARAVGIVLRRPPDVVNVHFAYDGIGAVIAARLRGVPIVVTFQGPWAQEAVASELRGRWPLSTKMRRFIERRVYRSASRCTVLSTAFRDLLISEYGVQPGRVLVIPPGIDLSPYVVPHTRVDARRELGLNERPTIVTVRRLVRRMGVDLLIDAIARLPSASRPQVAIAGAGAEREALERLAAERGLAGDIVFLGRVPDDALPTVYAAADLSVVPTRALEGFGYVVLEAYAAGTPVLATAIGGLVDVVGSFDPDRLVAPDADSLAVGVADALREPGSLPSPERCRAFAAEFAWSHIGPRVEAVFVEVLSQS